MEGKNLSSVSVTEDKADGLHVLRDDDSVENGAVTEERERVKLCNDINVESVPETSVNVLYDDKFESEAVTKKNPLLSEAKSPAQILSFDCSENIEDIGKSGTMTNGFDFSYDNSLIHEESVKAMTRAICH